MTEVTESYLGVEKGLEGADLAAVQAHARALVSAAEFDRPAPPGAAVKPETEERLAGVRALAAEIAALAEDGRATAADQAFTDLRRACVSCHVHVCDGDATEDAFPAREGTVFGRVRVLDVDGAERADPSNVVVFLEGPNLPREVVEPRTRPVISQKNRSFEPPVLAIVQGTSVDFPNDDSIFHNAFSLSKSRPFDLGVYETGEVKTVVFPDPGLVRIYCNIHAKMASSIVVLENPFFATTDRQGRFEIIDVPDGEYALRTYSDSGKETRQVVHVADSEQLEVSISIDGKEPVQHKNKFGKRYRAKY